MKQLTELELAHKEDDDRLVLEGRHILRRVMNIARYELEKLHKEAQAKGEIIRATGDPGALEKMLLSAAKRELTPKKEIERVSSSNSK